DTDRWVDLLTWTPTDAIKPGTASNELTVGATGDRLTFLINGIPVASEVGHPAAHGRSRPLHWRRRQPGRSRAHHGSSPGLSTPPPLLAREGHAVRSTHDRRERRLSPPGP